MTSFILRTQARRSGAPVASTVQQSGGVDGTYANRIIDIEEMNPAVGPFSGHDLPERASASAGQDFLEALTFLNALRDHSRSSLAIFHGGD